MNYWRERELVPRMPCWAYTPSSQAHFYFLALVGVSEHPFAPQLGFPLAPRPGSLGHSLSFSSLEHLAFFPNALFSSISAPSVYCLLPEPSASALAGPFASWAFPKGFVLHHSALKSSTHTHNSESCSVFLFSSHTLNFCRSIGAKFNWRILLCTISIALFPI